MGGGPAGTEQLRENRLVGFEQALLVARVRATLLGEEEAGAGHAPTRTGIKGLLNVAALSDPAGKEQRECGWQLLPHLLKQIERRRLTAHVATGITSLEDQGIGAPGVRRLRLRRRAALVDPDARGASLGRAPEA